MITTNVATLMGNVATFKRVVKMTSQHWNPTSRRSREVQIQRRDVVIQRHDVVIQRRDDEIQRRDVPEGFQTIVATLVTNVAPFQRVVKINVAALRSHVETFQIRVKLTS